MLPGFKAADLAAACIRIVCGTQVRSYGFGFEPGQYVFFANHTSHLDFLVIWAALPDALRRRTRPVAAADYWDARPIRRALSAGIFRSIFVDRNRVDPTVDALAPIVEALEQGDSIILFPEGTRSLDGTLQPFKSGIYRLASRFPSIHFIPVYLENLNRILPKGECLIVPILSSVAFGPALARIDGEDKESFLGRAREPLMEMMR